jgi:hypothetical protein
MKIPVSSPCDPVPAWGALLEKDQVRSMHLLLRRFQFPARGHTFLVEIHGRRHGQPRADPEARYDK